MTITNEIIAGARHFLGVQFVHQGRSIYGLDCLGLLILTAQALQLKFGQKDALDLDVPHYGSRPDVALLKRKLDTHLLPIDVADAQAGDVLLLRVEGSAQHLALLTDYPVPGELGMIHAYAPARRVVEHRYDAHWRDNTAAAYRLPGVA